MFAKILVANRGEIAVRAFRAATELGAKTVAVFPHEDRKSEHRLKADESYQIGEEGHPVRAYLDHENIVRVAVECGADAIYPGYGFLSENPLLAEACEANGITFIGPPASALHLAGNKSRAITAAREAGLPTLDSAPPTTDLDELAAAAEGIGFPVFVKAVSGGGGRGMRRVDDPSTLRESLEAAQREADAAFGDPTLYLEQAVVNPRHIEVQVLADSTRHRAAPVRARLLGAAPPPEGRRDRAGAEPRPRHPRADVRRCRALRRVDRLPQRRHRRVPPRRGRPLRLHRDEPAHPGGAHRHRGGHRRRPRRRPDAPRVRGDLRRPRHAPGRTSTCAARHCSAASPPRTPPTASARMPGRSPCTARPAVGACASTAAPCSSVPRSAPTSTRCSSSSPAAGAPSRWRCAGPDGPWRSSGSAVCRPTSRSSRPCSPTRCSRTARPRPASSTSAPSCSRPGWAATVAPSCSPTWPTSRSTSRTAPPRRSSSPAPSCRRSTATPPCPRGPATC